MHAHQALHPTHPHPPTHPSLPPPSLPPAGTPRCQLCKAGTYPTRTFAASVLPEPGGVPRGNNWCTPCPMGFYRSAKSLKCVGVWACACVRAGVGVCARGCVICSQPP